MILTLKNMYLFILIHCNADEEVVSILPYSHTQTNNPKVLVTTHTRPYCGRLLGALGECYIDRE